MPSVWGWNLGVKERVRKAKEIKHSAQRKVAKLLFDDFQSKGEL